MPVAGEPCDAQCECVFGNAAYRDAAVTSAAAALSGQNGAGVRCADPLTAYVGGADNAHLAGNATRGVILGLRARCGYPPRAAACTSSFVKTPLDSFLIGVATTVVLVQHSRLYAGLSRDDGVGAAQVA